MGPTEWEIIPFPNKCLSCSSDQALESRFIGAASPGIDAASSFRILSAPLCAPCRRKRLSDFLHYQVAYYAAWAVGCLGGVLFAWFTWWLGPNKPPEGYAFTPQAAGFYGFLFAASLLVGIAGAVSLPLCLALAAEAFRKERRFERFQVAEETAVNAVYVEAARGPLGSDALSAGATPEATIPIRLAKPLLEDYPDKADLIRTACDRQLRNLPLYFPYFLFLAGAILIPIFAWDLQSYKGPLSILGVSVGISGLTFAFVRWVEYGYNDSRETFSRNIFRSRGLRYFCGMVAAGLLWMGLSIPACLYGIRTHPNVIYRSYDKWADAGVLFEYPREWERRPFLLVIPKSDVIILIRPDIALPRDRETFFTELNEGFRTKALERTGFTGRVEPLPMTNGQGILTTEQEGDKRTLTAYVRDAQTAYWQILQMSGQPVNASHEEAFFRILRHLRFVHN